MESNSLILAYNSDNLEDPAATVVFTTRTTEGKKHGEIGMLSAKLEQTGKGVGRLLMNACEERAKTENCDAIQLEIL